METCDDVAFLARGHTFDGLVSNLSVNCVKERQSIEENKINVQGEIAVIVKYIWGEREWAGRSDLDGMRFCFVAFNV